MRGVGQVLLTVFISYSEYPFSVYTLYSVHTYLYTQYTAYIGNLSKHGLLSVLCRAKNNNNIICFHFYLPLFHSKDDNTQTKDVKKAHSRLGRFFIQLLSESVRRKYGFYNATLVLISRKFGFLFGPCVGVDFGPAGCINYVLIVNNRLCCNDSLSQNFFSRLTIHRMI